MTSSPTFPPDAQLRILAVRLAKTAKVPGVDQDDFCNRICNIVLRIRVRHRRKPGFKLVEAADAARTLQNAFFRLKKEDRDHVENIKQSQMQFMDGEIRNTEATIMNLSILLNHAVGRPSPLPGYMHLFRKGSKVKHQMLRELVFGLLAATRDTGVKLTFNQNSVSGTLADVLNALRKYLPGDLVPDPLPRRTIQRLKTEFVGFRRHWTKTK